MNNTKWRRLLSCLCECKIGGAVWKFTNSEALYQRPIPNNQILSENHIMDAGGWEPTFYKDIEYLKIPSSYIYCRVSGMAPWTKENDIAAIAVVVAKIGKYDVDLTSTHLIIYGYRG